MTILLVLSLILLVNIALEHYLLVILVDKSSKLETGPKFLLVELRQSATTLFFLVVFLIVFRGENSLLLLLLLSYCNSTRKEVLG